MPIHLLVPSLHRIQDASPRSPDSPHPLHALLEPLLLSVRSTVAKYHTELPQILAHDGGEGEMEESMMWYALGYEMSELGQGSTSANSEDAIILEEKSRNTWLERLERRECVSICRTWMIALATGLQGTDSDSALLPQAFPAWTMYPATSGDNTCE